MPNIKIQKENFSVEEELNSLAKQKSGAVVSFIGFVRDFNETHNLKGLYLDCYEDMAYKQLMDIIKNATELYKLNDVRIVHRIGFIGSEEQIVLILVSAKHRAEAFEGCSYIMDYLKIKAPFFKKEIDTNNIDHWLNRF
ncbi:MAG: molybdenum cofactor biosynthesis protein MoaE [Alphaproteobacteria bacterium]|nr:molybdenum cofactor biosynthesis protein MoaE [Alphaproteobacteria bacterium]